jgi:demethylmenaquinone methyltransferase/2-methoxy-6-polyprenyl-1,4-benzoquinol methylase
MRLPVRDSSMDGATVAFGIRNVQAAELACTELARALRQGGRLAILEFGIPTVPVISQLYRWYFTRALPMIGRLLSGHAGAYSYLPESVGSFTSPAEFVKLLQRAGFTSVQAVQLTFGVVYLYTAVRGEPVVGSP